MLLDFSRNPHFYVVGGKIKTKTFRVPLSSTIKHDSPREIRPPGYPPVRRNYNPERVEILSLELITLTVKSIEAETVRGVRVTVSGTCQVKVDAFTQQDLAQNLPQITLACQHFLGKVRRAGGGEDK